MGELRTVQLRTGPFHARVCRTFAEIHVVFARETFQISIVEDQRLIDQTVDHQTIIFLLQLDRARVVTLKRAALRRDRPIQRMDRREVDRADRVGGQPLDVAAHHIVLKPNGQAVRRGIHTFAKSPLAQFCTSVISGSGSPAARAMPAPATAPPAATAPFRNARREAPLDLLSAVISVLSLLFQHHIHLHEFDECKVSVKASRCAYKPLTLTLLFGSNLTVPCLRMWLSTTSQICGPSVPSLTLAQPATT